MKKGEICMKYLRINNNNGEFSVDGEHFVDIDNITKEQLLTLLDIALSEEDFEIDEYDADTISNPAHKIIYSNLYNKFTELLKNRQQFIDDVDDLYKEAYEKYSVEEQSDENSNID